MRKFVLVMVLGLFIGCALVGADLKSSVIVDNGHLFVYYGEDNDTYLLKIDSSEGNVIKKWDADDIDNLKLLKFIGDDILLYGNSDTLYRYSLPEQDGGDPVEKWSIRYVMDDDYILTDDSLIVEKSSSRIDIYSLEDGEETEELTHPNEKFHGFASDGYYTTKEDDEILSYYDLDGQERWSVDIERVVFKKIYVLDGYVLLANDDRYERRIYCIDDEGNKKWTKQYPHLFLPFKESRYSRASTHAVFRAGDYAVFADSDTAAFVDLETGELKMNLSPGIDEVPYGIHGNILIKITALPDYNRYGGLGDVAVLFNTAELNYNALIVMPEPIISSPKPVPAIDGENKIMYLPLADQRIMGISLDTGAVQKDFTVEPFQDKGSGW